jgi:hypothetical protein
MFSSLPFDPTRIQRESIMWSIWTFLGFWFAEKYKALQLQEHASKHHPFSHHFSTLELPIQLLRSQIEHRRRFYRATMAQEEHVAMLPRKRKLI